MQSDRPTVRREFSTIMVPRMSSFHTPTHSNALFSPTPSSPGMASPSSTTSSMPPTPTGRLRRSNAPSYIALPSPTMPSTQRRSRARSDAINTPLAYDAEGTVVFGIRTPTYEARTPLFDSPVTPGRAAHRVELAGLERVRASDVYPADTMAFNNYFDNVYGPVQCRPLSTRLPMRNRKSRFSLGSEDMPPPMSPETDESPTVTPLAPETPFGK